MKRVDENQAKIVKELRDIGATVQSLAEIGGGCPDILVGAQGKNWLFEIKNPEKPPSQRKLTPKEKAWRDSWRGQIHTIKTFGDALRILSLGV